MCMYEELIRTLFDSSQAGFLDAADRPTPVIRRADVLKST